MIRAYGDLYERLARGCRTINQMNKLHIALDRRMTPIEAWSAHDAVMGAPGWVSRLCFLPIKMLARTCQRFTGLRRLAGRRPERAYEQRRWAIRLRAMHLRSGKAEPEPFRRARLCKNVTLYSGGGDPATKTLALCFTGASGRLFMPISVVLQHLDARETDVALVHYPHGKGFRHGLDNLGCNFEATVDALQALTRPERYRRAVAVGTSGGGIAALISALRLGLGSALSVGGTGPDDARWSQALGVSPGELLRSYAGRLATVPNLFLVYGFDHEGDKASAHAIARLLPAELIEIDNPSGRVGHNALLPPLMRGQLRALLESTVLASTRPVLARPFP